MPTPSQIGHTSIPRSSMPYFVGLQFGHVFFVQGICFNFAAPRINTFQCVFCVVSLNISIFVLFIVFNKSLSKQIMNFVAQYTDTPKCMSYVMNVHIYCNNPVFWFWSILRFGGLQRSIHTDNFIICFR